MLEMYEVVVDNSIEEKGYGADRDLWSAHGTDIEFPTIGQGERTHIEFGAIKSLIQRRAHLEFNRHIFPVLTDNNNCDPLWGADSRHRRLRMAGLLRR